jgi:NTP pyrophosphatase (non-canonical NTP hydrolase)
VSGRAGRQARVAAWCAGAFGADAAGDPELRALRLVEEALEAYQSVGGDEARARLALEHVFGRPAGDPAQELGGVGVTALALAAALGLDADEAERREVERALSLPRDRLSRRALEKAAAGLGPRGTRA